LASSPPSSQPCQPVPKSSKKISFHVGEVSGLVVGLLDGDASGLEVGALVVPVGDSDGLLDGDEDCVEVGSKEGVSLGTTEGASLPVTDGDEDAALVGISLAELDGFADPVPALAVTDGALDGNVLSDGVADGWCEP